MNITKCVLAALAGGIIYFFLGFLVYGIALSHFYTVHSLSSADSMRSNETMIWWALLLGNFFWGLALTWVYEKVKKTGGTFFEGAKIGLGMGFLVFLAVDLIRYATTLSYDLQATVADVVVEAILSALAGGVAAWVLGKLSKPASSNK